MNVALALFVGVEFAATTEYSWGAKRSRETLSKTGIAVFGTLPLASGRFVDVLLPSLVGRSE
jgi:hypothetical protein